MRAGDNTGGHTLWALWVVGGAGVVGRYLYSFVPRAANGRELDLAELRTELALTRGDIDGLGEEFGARVSSEVERLVDGGPLARLISEAGLGALVFPRPVKKKSGGFAQACP